MIKNVAILAGGHCVESGYDKALVSVFGTPLIQHVSERFMKRGFNVSVISKDVTKYLNVLSGSVEHVEDIYEESAPMVGVITALEHFRQPVFILSADAPNMPPEIAELALESMVQGSSNAAVPEIDGVVHTLMAAYSPSCLQSLKLRFSSGDYDLADAVKGLDTLYLDTDFFKGQGSLEELFRRVTAEDAKPVF